MAASLRFDVATDGPAFVFDGQEGSGGSGDLQAQAAAVVGAGNLGLLASGVLAAQAAVVESYGFINKVGSGVLQAAVAAVAGEGVGVGSLEVRLTIANGGRYLADNDGDPLANLSNIAWEWYDTPDSSEGEPIDSGVASTNANGEITLTINNTTHGPGQYGQLFLFHPTNPHALMSLYCEVF